MKNEKRKDYNRKLSLLTVHSSLLIVYCLLFIFLSCENPISSVDNPSTFPEGTIPAEKGSFSLTLSGVARTIVPVAPNLNDFAVYNLAFTPTNSGSAENVDRTNATLATQSVLLDTGTYTLVVSAYKDTNKTELAAQGTLEGVTITAGENTAATVTLKALLSGGTGTFRWDITIPSGVTASMTIAPGTAGGTNQQTVPLTPPAASGSRSLNSGQYNLTFNLKKTDEKATVWNEALYVYQNLESVFSFTFTDEYFSDSVYAVTFNSNDGVQGEWNQSVLHGAKLTSPTNPTKNAYTFNGWYTDNDTFANPYDFNNPVIEPFTLYAKWTLSRYTVTFTANGGTPAPAQQTIDHGGTVTEPAAMTRTNYAFDGWYREAVFTNIWNFETDTVTGPLNLYAKWVTSYAVTFTANSGTPAPARQDIAPGGKVTEPPPMTRTNYVFDAWYRETVFTTKWNFDTDTVTASMTLYARWLAARTVTFNANSGTPAPPQQIVGNGNTVTEPPPMTREGYEFDGWYTSSAFTTKWNFDTDTVTGNITLYARWIRYTITFNADSGTPAPATQYTVPGGKVTEPPPMTRNGYLFDAWYTEAAFTNKFNFDTPINADITLYARWITAYTVTFEANGGTPVPPAQIIAAGGKVTEPPPITRSGFTFGGWYVEEALYNPWDFEYPVNTNRTLYAKWNVNPGTVLYTVSFETAGGSSVASQTVAANVIVSRPADPTRTGYTFVDWYSDMALTTVYNFSSPVTANITLYAKWNAPGCTVVYDANGGSGTMANSSFTYGVYQSLRPNTFTRDGYVFAGWATTATGTIARTDREAVGTLSSTDGATVNLYAVWNTVETISGSNLNAKLVWLSINGVNNNTTYILEANAHESLVPQTLSYSGRSNVVIILRGVGAERIIDLSANGSLFTVGSGVTLILDNNITLQGHAANNSSVVTVNSGGRLVMNTGAKITGNKVTSAGSSNYYGGGVTVSGTFTMNGGEIYGNSSSTSYSGGGVTVRGTFTMNGGKIYDNASTYYSTLSCGGVYILNGTFTMNDGEISGNTASNGSGGVDLGISGNNTFTMNGGKISNNTGRDGGGVYMSGTSSSSSNYLTFIMNGGEISGNTASSNGGGVYVDKSSNNTVTFTKTGGTITNNNAVQGRMVYATANSVTKRKENTAGPGVNLYYYGGTVASAYTGDWDY